MLNQKVEKAIDELKSEILDIFKCENQAIQKLQKEIDQLRRIIANSEDTKLVVPEYGTIPVPAVIHEQVIGLAQVRGVPPAILMNNPKVIQHLLLLFEREII